MLLLPFFYIQCLNRIREIVIPTTIKYFPALLRLLHQKRFLFEQFGTFLFSRNLLNFGCSCNSFSDHLVQKGYNVVALMS